MTTHRVFFPCRASWVLPQTPRHHESLTARQDQQPIRDINGATGVIQMRRAGTQKPVRKNISLEGLLSSQALGVMNSKHDQTNEHNLI